MMKYLLSMILVLCCAMPALRAQEPAVGTELPTYTCKQIDREIVLTGKLDDPLWQQAEVVDLVESATGIRRGARTTARLLWSKRYLYVGFDSEDDYLLANHTKRDDPVYEEDAVELFICPSGKLRQYYEIEVSPRNVIFDTYVLNGKDERRWNWDNFHTLIDYDIPGLTTKVFADGELNQPGTKGWKVEIAIPLKSLIGADSLIPAVGDKWRMNMYRLDGNAEGKNRLGYYAWSPIMRAGDFHRPWRFGTLLFQQQDPPKQ